MGLGDGKEQFSITTRVDGKVIREQKIHDPFLWNRTTIAISRWDLFKALFRKQFITTVEVKVDGTEGVIRAVMMLDPKTIEADTEAILADRKKSREERGAQEHCYTAD